VYLVALVFATQQKTLSQRSVKITRPAWYANVCCVIIGYMIRIALHAIIFLLLDILEAILFFWTSRKHVNAHRSTHQVAVAVRSFVTIGQHGSRTPTKWL
jgi:hypothetical protein